MSKITPMMKLTEHEMKMLALADALKTDILRQGAFSVVDALIRERLKVSDRRYYTWNEVGDVTVDMKRDRVPPVKKLSKSDL